MTDPVIVPPVVVETPAVVATVVAPVVATPNTPPAAAAAAQVAATDPNYLKDRLDRARRKTLEKLGYDLKKNEDVDAFLEKQKGETRTAKSENKILRKAMGEFQATAETTSAAIKAKDDAIKTQNEAIQALVNVEIAGLPADKRDAVKASLTGDGAAQLKQLAALKALAGIAPASAPAPVVTPVTPPPVAAPATSTPSGAAPTPPATPTTPEDFAAVYRSLKDTNPYAAADYMLQHAADIYPQFLQPRTK